MCTDLVNVTCAECSVRFCLTAALHQRRKDDHKSFYCPAGHSNYFPGKSEQEKRIESLETYVASLTHSLERAHDQAQSARELGLAIARGAQVCPFGCGWIGHRRLSMWGADQATIGRFQDRAGHDLAEHLQDAHHAAPAVVKGLLSAGA